MNINVIPYDIINTYKYNAKICTEFKTMLTTFKKMIFYLYRRDINTIVF